MYQSNINTELELFCPRASCTYYQAKENTIHKDGMYRTKNDWLPLQMFYKKCFVKGESKDFPDKTQNISYVERINLTLRQRISFLRLKSLGFCKKKGKFNHILWINLFDYNYRRMHKNLRIPLEQEKRDLFQKRWRHRTPAMAMGLTQKQLSWRFLLVAPIPATH